MQNHRLFAAVRRAYERYDRFMEKQGFGIVMAVCVVIITSSAAYTFHFREQWAQEDLPQEASVQAGGTQDSQTLADVQALIASQSARQTAVSTEPPFSFDQPVEGFLDRDYSMQEPQHFPSAHYYRLHPGIDLKAEYGAIVSACADGTVVRVWQDNELGQCVRIRHDKYEAVYAGLSAAHYVRQGDPVRKGDTIGHVGNGVLAETDAGPHLHLEVWLNQTPVDPVELFLGIQP